jgi:hypothetical protein
MKGLLAVLLGIGILSGVFASTPAYALGGCGENYHRGSDGRCYWGGQNQDWCIKQTGHAATHMPDGTWRCER